MLIDEAYLVFEGSRRSGKTLNMSNLMAHFIAQARKRHIVFSNYRVGIPLSFLYGDKRQDLLVGLGVTDAAARQLLEEIDSEGS